MNRHSSAQRHAPDPSPGRSTIDAATEPATGADAARAYSKIVLARLIEGVSLSAAADASRLALFAPVAIGLGAGAYFSLAREPVFWIAPALALGAALAGVALRSRALAACFLIALGFAAADLRTDHVAAPQIEREFSPRMVTGRLVSFAEGERGRRLLIAVEAIDGVERGRLPARVRVTWRGADFNAAPGDKIALRAGLSPPPEPVAPGAFDFARYLFFQQIGGVGFAVTPPDVLAPPADTFTAKAAITVEALRLRLFRRITSAAESEGGAIIAAVVTGKREAIAPAARDALRDSGLAHLLAISGLHMGLVTGLLFFAVRGALALSERLALNAPIKKIAAVAALAGGLFYLILSGGGWSARRAFIMTAIVFIAIIADRRGLSLRNIAIAATLILLTTPEALLHPGFQMSFAAVTALIAAFEWASARANPDRRFDIIAKARRYVVGVAATDTIAALATAPYALYHFNRTALYSLPANIAAMPLMAFWIMPFAVTGLLLTPFGMDAWAWRTAAAGMDVVLSVASTVSRQPGAIILTPQWPVSALIILTLGGLWSAVMTARWRFAGLAALPLSMALVGAAPPPDIFIARAGDNVGVVLHEKDAPAAIAVADRRKNRFDARAWAEAAGLAPGSVKSMKDAGACDANGCVITAKGGMVLAVSKRLLTLAEDCRRADIVIAFYPVNRRTAQRCPARLVHRRMVWNSGAHAIWIGDRGVKIRAVADARGERPWTHDWQDARINGAGGNGANRRRN